MSMVCGAQLRRLLFRQQLAHRQPIGVTTQYLGQGRKIGRGYRGADAFGERTQSLNSFLLFTIVLLLSRALFGVPALLTLLLARLGLDVIGFIGILLLIGIVKKNGIMLVDFALQREREGNMPPEESIREA